MFAFILTFILLVVPIFLIFYMAIEIYHRNRSNGTNRIAFGLFLSITLLSLDSLLVNLFPEAHKVQAALLFVYVPAFVTMGLALRFFAGMTGQIRLLPRPLFILLCYCPAIPCILLWMNAFHFSAQFVMVGDWTYVTPNPPLRSLMLAFAGYTIFMSICFIITGLHHMNNRSLRIVKKQLRTILLGLVLTTAWVIPFVLNWIPLHIPETIHTVDLSIYGVLIFVMSIRYAMIKYDFLPPLEHKYRILYEKSPLSILLLDNTGDIQEANAEAAQLFACRRTELAAYNIWHFLSVPGEEKQPIDSAARSGQMPQSPVSGEYRVHARNGDHKYVQLDCEEIESNGEHYLYLVLLDITEKKIAEEKISYLAYHDELTGLNNRHRLQQRLKKELSRKKSKESFALLLLDLDRFKQINDTQGHYVGDLLLRHVAMQLRMSVPEEATIARLGGDEFALIVPLAEDGEKQKIGEIAANIFEGLKPPFIYQQKAFEITASMGICLSNEVDGNAEELLQYADIAMYRAKKLGRNRFAVYEPSFREMEQEIFQLHDRVRAALNHEEMILHYQPQVDIQTGRLVGAEALIRWMSADRGLIMPGEFIPHVNDSELIVRIGYWVLENACRQIRAWRREGLPPLLISINLTAKQFHDPNFLHVLERMLDQYEIDPRYLCIEVTESTAMDEEDHGFMTCRQIVSMGVRLSIDDFGTGYSSLALLKQLPVHSIKIDSAFIQHMTEDEDDQAIIRAIIAIAQSLKKIVVAEGVEEQEQWDLLGEFGCSEGQGYYISPALPVESFTRFVETKGSWPQEIRYFDIK